MNSDIRVLVCGGRDYRNRNAVFSALDRLVAWYGISVVIHGAARGADQLASDWAKDRGVSEMSFPADWDRDGRRAGVIRNRQMLKEGKPYGIVAFPGGRGTADMVRAAREAGVPVWEPEGNGRRP